jgi:hypothetical protein
MLVEIAASRCPPPRGVSPAGFASASATLGLAGLAGPRSILSSFSFALV